MRVAALAEVSHGESACAGCARRSWLLANMSGLLDRVARDRERFAALLALDDRELIAAIGGRRRAALSAAWAELEGNDGIARARAGETTCVCRHQAGFPVALEQAGAPRLLHVAGAGERLEELCNAPVVALLGATAASDYGCEVAKGLARGLASCGVTVVSMLRPGIGLAVQMGALEARGAALALVGDGLEVVARGRHRALYAQIADIGCVLSELPSDAHGRSWGWIACERTAVQLAALTVLVEHTDSRRALWGAHTARELGGAVAAVPGQVTSPLAAGSHQLLREGATLIRDAHDALELLYPLGAHRVAAPALRGGQLEPRLRRVLELVAGGCDSAEALLRAGAGPPSATLLALTELELMGRLRRGGGGRYVVCA